MHDASPSVKPHERRLENGHLSAEAGLDPTGAPVLLLGRTNGRPLDWVPHAGAPVRVQGAAGEPDPQFAGFDSRDDALLFVFRLMSGLVVTVVCELSRCNPVVVIHTEVSNPDTSVDIQFEQIDAMGLVLSAGSAIPVATYVLGWLDVPRVDAPGRPPAPFRFGNWIDKLLYEGEEIEIADLPPAGWSTPTMRVITEPLTRLPLRSGKRSTYDTFPWAAVRSAQRGTGFFTGFEWSGSWHIDIDHFVESGTVTIETGTAGYAHTLGPRQTLRSPRAFLGFFEGDWDAAFNASRRYSREEIIPPRPAGFPFNHYVFFPGALTGPAQKQCYFPTLGSDNQLRLRRIVELAKEAGCESFLLDAGWWNSWPGYGDFSSGLGDFEESRILFPHGLRALSDLVHENGMVFGLWFEFERVDIRTAERGRRPWSTQWLVHQKGYPYRSWGQHYYLMCLGHDPATDWALDNLSWAVREYGVDWFMIDSNEWAVCRDEGHTHGPHEGEWAQINGLYRVLSGLRAEFPKLIIDNSAGGGQRADFGLARYCDAMPCSDVNSPSVMNRQYSHGYGCFYPSYYFRQSAHSYPAVRTGPVSKANPYPWPDGFDPVSADRSLSPERLEWRLLCRIVGIFQPTFDLSGLTDEQLRVVKKVGHTFKRIRSSLAGDRFVLCGPPVFIERENRESGRWEVHQFVSTDRETVSVVAYRPGGEAARFRAVLQGLNPEATYRVDSHTGRVKGEWTGSLLMDEGITITLPEPRGAEVLVLERQGPD